jgi:hypothetical protein
MEKLITDSITILQEEGIQIAHDWMDIADLICYNQRTDKALRKNEFELLNKLNPMIKRVKLEDDIVLYKGLTVEFDPILAGKQYNTLSANLHVALNYGSYIIKVIVPKGSNALNIGVRREDDKTVILLPGEFTLIEDPDGNLNRAYLYTQF